MLAENERKRIMHRVSNGNYLCIDGHSSHSRFSAATACRLPPMPVWSIPGSRPSIMLLCWVTP